MLSDNFHPDRRTFCGTNLGSYLILWIHVLYILLYNLIIIVFFNRIFQFKRDFHESWSSGIYELLRRWIEVVLIKIVFNYNKYHICKYLFMHLNYYYIYRVLVLLLIFNLFQNWKWGLKSFYLSSLKVSE